MDLLTLLIFGFVALIVVGILGSVFRWAKGLIGTLFSLAAIVLVVVIVMHFVNAGNL